MVENGSATLHNVKGAAKFLGVDRSTILRWKKTGRLSQEAAWSEAELLAARRNLPPKQAKRLRTEKRKEGHATPPETPPAPPKAPEEPPKAPESAETPPQTAAPEPDGPRVRLAENPEDLEVPLPPKKPAAPPATPETPPQARPPEPPKETPPLSEKKPDPPAENKPAKAKPVPGEIHEDDFTLMDAAFREEEKKEEKKP